MLPSNEQIGLVLIGGLGLGTVLKFSERLIERFHFKMAFEMRGFKVEIRFSDKGEE